MKTKNLFRIAISVVCFAFFLFLAGGSDESSSPSSSPSDSYEEPVTEPEKTPDTDEEEQKQEKFVPVNEEEDMTPESDEFIPQENEAVE